MSKFLALRVNNLHCELITCIASICRKVHDACADARVVRVVAHGRHNMADQKNENAVSIDLSY